MTQTRGSYIVFYYVTESGETPFKKSENLSAGLCERILRYEMVPKYQNILYEKLVILNLRFRSGYIHTVLTMPPIRHTE